MIVSVLARTTVALARKGTGTAMDNATGDQTDSCSHL